MGSATASTTAEMYFWLSGKIDEFHYLGGQSWPADILLTKPAPGTGERARYRWRYGVPGDITDRREGQSRRLR